MDGNTLFAMNTNRNGAIVKVLQKRASEITFSTELKVSANLLRKQRAACSRTRSDFRPFFFYFLFFFIPKEE